MNDTRHGLLSIGSFASAAQLSLKALRLYAQLGILTPIHIDPESSYRYYHADQLQTARLIRMMRQIDMRLASIRQVLAAAPADAERMVIEHCNMLDARAEQARRTVQDLVCYLRQEVPTMTLDVSVQTAAPQQVMSITKHVRVEQLGNRIGESLESLYALTEAQGIKTTGAPFGIYHGPVNQEDDGPIEVCVPIERPLAATGNAVSRELAGGRVASVMMTGDQCEFPAILDGYDAVYDWIRKNGYEVIESPREIWHSLPGETQRTEIAWLFREPAG